jgi:nucleoside-diphosphate-sugar epimerase
VITGAAGNLGQRLIPHFESRGHLVRLVDRVAMAHPWSVVTDLSRPGDWHEVIAGADTLVHLAGGGRSGAQWSDLVADNIDAVLHVLDAASRHGVSRVVLASSVWANRERRRYSRSFAHSAFSCSSHSLAWVPSSIRPNSVLQEAMPAAVFGLGC